MRRIGIVVKYSNQLDGVIIDYKDNLNISAIKNKPISEWFEKIDGRIKWNGLIRQIREYIQENQLPLIFDFKGPEVKKREFEEQLKIHGIEPCTADGLTSEEIAEICIKRADEERSNNNLPYVFKYYYIAADEGNSAEYQYKVADIYRRMANGENNEYEIDEKQPLKKAFAFYIRSAKQEYKEAYSYLGDCYYFGYGTDKDYSEAFKYYYLANENGDFRIEHELAECYYNGLGCKVDKDKAYKVFLETRDFSRLMECCFYGYGRNVSYNEAFEYFEKIPNCFYRNYGDSNVENELGMLFDPTSVKKAEFVNKDGNKAFKLYKSAAKQGHSLAQNNLGYCYLNGIGTEKDEYAAFIMFSKSANQGDRLGQYHLGECFETGIGGSKDLSTASKWYNRSAQKELAAAQYKCGYFIENALVETANYTKAFEWYRKAAEQGYPKAESALGRCYFHKIGTRIINASKTFKWLKKAYDDGCLDSIKELGECYYFGKGTSIDYEKAFNLFQISDYNVMLMECYSKGNGTETDIEKAYLCFAETTSGGNNSTLLKLANAFDSSKKDRNVKKDDFKAIRLYQRAAEQGDPSAQNDLGCCFYNGRGTEKNEKEAFDCFFKSASQENKYAQFNLGVCYENGIGCLKDVNNAIIWYEKSAIQGYAKAQYKCGRFLESALAGNKDSVKAYEWYKKSAEQGYPQAEAALGKCYYYSIGMAVHDYSKAYEWLKKAYEDGCKDALQELGECYFYGRGTAPISKIGFDLFMKCKSYINLMECYYYGKGVDKNYEKAYVCFSQTSSGGDVMVLNDLGSYFFNKKEIKKAIKLFERAGEKGYNVAQRNCGLLYETKLSIVDFNKAYKWYKLSAENGNIKAQYDLGRCYEYGYGISKNKSAAFEWYHKAADNGHIGAQLVLGDLYAKGKLNVIKNEEQAFRWFLKAANNGNIKAQIQIGNCYANGELGIEKNEKLAFEWYRKAADQGDKKSTKYCTVKGVTYKTYDTWKKAQDKK